MVFIPKGYVTQVHFRECDRVVSEPADSLAEAAHTYGAAPAAEIVGAAVFTDDGQKLMGRGEGPAHVFQGDDGDPPAAGEGDEGEAAPGRSRRLRLRP